MDVGEVGAGPTGGAAGGAAGATGYDNLAQRAAAFVRGSGGAAHEDALIEHVFGSAGSATLWRPLLRQLLGADEAVALRPDGFWTLAGTTVEPSATAVGDFVAVDVETTGLRPLRQRVIEVAAIRFRDGLEVARFETLVNPGKRLPKYIAELTGIVDADLATAPGFGEIADELLELLGSSTLVGHNVEFDLGFLNAELKRADRPTLINERLDTLSLATALLPQMRRPNLAAVASALGLPAPPRGLHRAGADAALTAGVALHLADRARRQGIDVGSFEALRALSPARPERGKGRAAGRSRAVLDRSLLADIPKAPGVYLMRDAFDKIIYVGKAKNLRDRVGSYYSQPLGYTRKMDGLLESLTKIDVEVVGSELEALLLEAQLIRRYQPRYNTAMRSFEHYPFIRVDVGNPWPRVSLAKNRKEDGARYFGPFRNKTGARKTVDVVNRVVPLRTCSRSFKDARSYGSPCLELDLGRCLGPCVGRADRDVYAGLVRDVVGFLDGRDEALHEVLWRGLEDAAEKLDFERAEKLRRDLRQVNAVVGAQRRLREAVETQTLVLVLPSAEAGAREVLLVAGGRLWCQLRASRGAGAEDVARRLGASWGRMGERAAAPIDQDSVDETNILHRWLYQHAGHPAIVPLPAPPGRPDWNSVAAAVLDVSDEALKFEALVAADADDEDEGGVASEA